MRCLRASIKSTDLTYSTEQVYIWSKTWEYIWWSKYERSKGLSGTGTSWEAMWEKQTNSFWCVFYSCIEFLIFSVFHVRARVCVCVYVFCCAFRRFHSSVGVRCIIFVCLLGGGGSYSCLACRRSLTTLPREDPLAIVSSSVDRLISSYPCWGHVADIKLRGAESISLFASTTATLVLTIRLCSPDSVMAVYTTLKGKNRRKSSVFHRTSTDRSRKW